MSQAQLDSIWDAFDHLMHIYKDEERLDIIGHLISTWNPEVIDVNVGIAILSVTLPVKNRAGVRLPRHWFYKSFKARLQIDGEDLDVLQGLE